MKKLLLLVLSLYLIGTSYGQQKLAYQLYNAKGKKISYGKMLQVLTEKDIVLFGEFHNNAIAHLAKFTIFGFNFFLAFVLDIQTMYFVI